MLQEVIYILNFKANLLSVGHMTNARVDVKSSGEVSSLLKNSCEGDAADEVTMIDYSKTRANKR